MAEDELSCFQQRRAQPRIDATAARVQEGGHVAATGALAEADGDAVAGQGGQGFGIDHWPVLLPGSQSCGKGSLDQGVVLQIGAMGDSDLQAIRRPGIGIRGAAFGAIHKVLQVDAKATPVATLSGTLNPGIPATHNCTGSNGRDGLDLLPLCSSPAQEAPVSAF
jgi:hypothetical protein